MSAKKIISTKILTVIAIDTTQDITTGDPAHQVIFGEYVTCNANNNYAGKTVPAPWLTLHVRYIEPFPYIVGSKWKLVINEDNTFSLVEP
ncbi:MAG: hypothetical protein LBH62_03490 [Nitrososphaerota archaeon]|jgi:hypothetical protein|uniref:hypothetical protein n=1 Tax=Candidatus Bathycorpusculum sp. TaxID=2994959 RepID=UPI00282B0457|nr:hypothetical protein [Candidatus Termiticorpusculum sp.]MCL2257439.1 hypothetical protein [Candidatus Termiticorpusculum sp.]MCL2292458.1 hypothetical protein [Candidatus Termiticorpusculum sp.]MDR0460488.1 hypothetical protein [Nitrososphaerota archaeon]